MSRDLEERVSAALTVHDGMQRMIREDGLPADAIEPARGFIAALEGLGVHLVTEDVLTEALYSFHSWEPATARSEASAIMRALSRSSLPESPHP